MNSQKFAGTLATLIGLAVAAVVVLSKPKFDTPVPTAQKTEAAKTPAETLPAVRGPVVREVPQ
jgi:hypothetical protein